MEPDNGTTRSDTGRVVVEHDGNVHIGTTIVRAIGEATGTPVAEMGTQLYDVVDPDALNHLFADRLNGVPRRGGRVVLSVAGCTVTLDGDGVITVDPDER